MVPCPTVMVSGLAVRVGAGAEDTVRVVVAVAAVPAALVTVRV